MENMTKSLHSTSQLAETKLNTHQKLTTKKRYRSRWPLMEPRKRWLNTGQCFEFSGVITWQSIFDIDQWKIVQL